MISRAQYLAGRGGDLPMSAPVSDRCRNLFNQLFDAGGATATAEWLDTSVRPILLEAAQCIERLEAELARLKSAAGQ